MNKGERTRELILNRGMLQSSQYGLADITIGSISKLCGLSRSGVIAHFDDKHDMQVAILEYSGRQFLDNVIKPSKHEDAFIRLKNILNLWIDWTERLFPGEMTGCPFIKALVEYEHRQDSIVRRYAFSEQQEFLSFMGHLVEKAQQQGRIQTSHSSHEIAFELYSSYVGVTVVSSFLPTSERYDRLRSILENGLLRYEAVSK